MGKRGPERTDTAVLERRGAWRGKVRRQEESGGGRAERPKPKISRTPFRLTKKQIETICREPINGYDAWATADKGEWFDPEAARGVIKFFHCELAHVKGSKANQGFELERWQVGVLGNLFGWKRADGTRRYRFVLFYVPRKNGKTPIAAGIILYGLNCDGEPGAEIYGAASTYRQASLVWAHARGMVEKNEWLDAECQVFKGQAKAIERYDDHSVYSVQASDGFTADGWNTHIGVVDELHAQPNGELIEKMETSTAGRTQPLIAKLTTADFDREGSVCNEEYFYACKVRDGIIADSSYLPIIYEASSDDDWSDERVWEAANPNIDVSVSRDYLRRTCQKAKDQPAKLNSFLRLHLNIRTSTESLWLDVKKWDESAREMPDLDGEMCLAGLDLSATRDITGFGMLFERPDGCYFFLPKFWIPEAKANDPRRSDKVDYRQWVRDGWIQTTPGDAIDYKQIRRDIQALGQRYKIQEIAIDRLFQGEETAQRLSGQNPDSDSDIEFEVVAFGQGFYSMAAPTKRWDELFYEGKIHHDGNPVMRWMVDNVAVVFDDAGNMKPSKKCSTGRIDGVVTGIMALGRAMQVVDSTSVYESRGLLSI